MDRLEVVLQRLGQRARNSDIASEWLTKYSTPAFADHALAGVKASHVLNFGSNVWNMVGSWRW